ncbi:MAG: fumarylacetoacetate hydrolase family protein [Saprospiraceae bacterium]|nr:fumarylacetoacetate hydrolase family protein [Saprospiraceae bacterium]MCB0577667.1 fumarylacetoacetate hydrolase family protein [Saprospiraceae bacterium]MCB9305223.1 fumarylacetoacetate hydrolase family protein [Lewinellaceae bacterium]MCB9354368.1 fumarylacetoacetate hydrolase family protein [Lewinellaceae bacterium]
MKIFCIGRNYVDHAKELNNPVPSEPLVFMKPPTALLVNNKHFYYPDFTKDLHYEGEIVLRVCKNGRSVEPEFASGYYDAVAFGIDFTARDLQDKLKSKGQPWEIAKGFDRSAPVSRFIPLSELPNVKDIHFQLKRNGEVVQDGHTSDLIFSFDTLICHISKYFTLHKGDFIFTGTPAGVGPVQIGDLLEGYIEGREMLKCAIK